MALAPGRRCAFDRLERHAEDCGVSAKLLGPPMRLRVGGDQTNGAAEGETLGDSELNDSGGFAASGRADERSDTADFGGYFKGGGNFFGDGGALQHHILRVGTCGRTGGADALNAAPRQALARCLRDFTGESRLLRRHQ